MVEVCINLVVVVASEDDDSEESQNPGLLASFVSRIVENLQVFVEDIHIRYEDNETIPNVRIE